MINNIIWQDDDVVMCIDGNMYCAVRHDFTNLQESPAGFGQTQELALMDLQQQEEP